MKITFNAISEHNVAHFLYRSEISNDSLEVETDLMGLGGV